MNAIGTSAALPHLGAAVMAVCAMAMLADAATRPAHAEDGNIAIRRAAERTSFSSAEIVDGFFKVAFGTELGGVRRADRIRRFDEPVRVFIDNRVMPDRRADIAAALADIGARIRHIDLGLVDDRANANLIVTLVRDRDLPGTLRALYGSRRAERLNRALDPQCLSSFSKDSRYRIRQARAILPADVNDFIFYDCVYEELLQALGPINDDDSVPWTMFNDRVQMGFFDVYDQHLLNILYDPRIRPGMPRDKVEEMLPQVLPDVRTWVDRINGLIGAPRRSASAGDK